MWHPPAKWAVPPYRDDVHGEPQDKRMRLRYAGTCRVCGADLAAKADAIYERGTKTVRCVSHERSDAQVPAPDANTGLSSDDPKEILAGTAGASARREFERRRSAREARIRTTHPRLGGLILALSDDPQSTTAWNTGALGEERLGRGLDNLADETVWLLHDRRLPRSRANIDHLAVTRSGIYVIDAKKYRGRPNLKVDGGLLRPRVERLLVGSRDCTKLLDGVHKQVAVVRDLLEPDVPVHGVLCFVEADWPLLGGSFVTHDVHVVWPKKLYSMLKSDGPLTLETIRQVHSTLGRALQPA